MSTRVGFSILMSVDIMSQDHLQIKAPDRHGRVGRLGLWRAMSRRKKYGRIPRGLVYLYRMIVVFSAIVVALYVAWIVLVPKPSMSNDPVSTPPLASDPVEEEPDISDAGPYQRKEDCWTFLLIGTDDGNGNTDTLMYLTYDVKNQKVSVASIPRDTRIDTSHNSKKINAAYAYDGIDGLKQAVSTTLGIPVDYYIKVDINAFVALVDEVDGIDYYVPCDMDYDDPWQDLSIHYKEGMQHLSGQQALEVCRFRHDNNMMGYSDTGRMQTQREVLTAVAQKVLSWGNVTRINEFMGIFADYVDTDLSLTDLIWFAGQALYFDMDGLNTMTLPAEWHSPYMYLDTEETLSMVNQYLNPYTTDRTADQLNIPTRS